MIGPNPIPYNAKTSKLISRNFPMTQKVKIGVYPGTFDPVTFGHIDIIERASGIFDKVIVAVAHHSSGKKPLFSINERKEMLTQSTKNIKNVTIEDFDGLVVQFAKQKGATAMVRGIRMLSDFEYEFQMALTNRKLAGDIETIFLMPHVSYSYLSSNLLKEVAALDGDISSYAPEFVAKSLKKKLKN